MEPAELRARARRAYELGRARWSLHVLWWVAPLVLASVIAAGNARVSLATGVALAAAAAGFRWRGQAWAAAVSTGLLAGFLPFALLLSLKCCAGYVCALGGCMAHCGRFCAAGGLAAGLLLAARARRVTDGASQFLVAGGVIAALTGLLGCFVGGITGALWMALGELAATLPVVAGALRRRGS